MRMTMIQNFTKQGQPGIKFKNACEKMIKTLSLPKGAKEELGFGGDGDVLQYDVEEEPSAKKNERADDEPPGEEVEEIDPKVLEEKIKAKYERKKNVDIFGEGKYHLIPSFFRTLMYLKKQKREFAVVFRTFGSDSENVIHEFNKFCSGEHPCFNGKNNTPQVRLEGSKNSKDFRFRNDM